MTSQPPETSSQPPATLEQIAAATAALITDARQAGLALPCSLNCNDYGPPAASLLVSEYDTPNIWQALRQWATHYGTEVTTRPSINPGNLYISAAFQHDGISYEVYTIINPDGDGTEATPLDQAA
jgi:hypothetical protein